MLPVAGDTTGAEPPDLRGLPPGSEPSSRPFTVLVVCRANRCRSPMMEFLLRRDVQVRGLPWRVVSAGVDAEPGLPMHPFTARVLRRRGVRLTLWASRPLTDRLVAEADLILTASEAHRGLIAVRYPRALTRTFTLLSFAHQAGRLRPDPEVAPGGYGRWLVAAVNCARARSQPLPVSSRSIPDLLGQPYSRFRGTAATVARAVSAILAAAPRARPDLASAG